MAHSNVCSACQKALVPEVDDAKRAKANLVMALVKENPIQDSVCGLCSLAIASPSLKFLGLVQGKSAASELTVSRKFASRQLEMPTTRHLNQMIELGIVESVPNHGYVKRRMVLATSLVSFMELVAREDFEKSEAYQLLKQDRHLAAAGLMEHRQAAIEHYYRLNPGARH